MEIPTGPELLRRAQLGHCLGCDLPGMTLDLETGFPAHYCGDCAPKVEEARLQHDRATKERPRDRKDRKTEGLNNLDRLLED